MKSLAVTLDVRSVWQGQMNDEVVESALVEMTGGVVNWYHGSLTEADIDSAAWFPLHGVMGR